MIKKIDISISVQTIQVGKEMYKITVEKVHNGKCICGCDKPRETIKSMYASKACKTRVYRRNLVKNKGIR